MAHDSSSDSQGAVAQPGAVLSKGRRRLLRGSLGAAPVLATFVSQPVHATYSCKSASAYTSANASRPAVTPCNGSSPSWWRTNTGSWVGCSSGVTLFSTYFSVTSGYPAGTKLLQVLQGTSTAAADKLARNMVACLLNIKSSRIGTAVFDEAQLKTIWLAASGGGGYTPTPGGPVWSSAEVNTWLATVFPAEV